MTDKEIVKAKKLLKKLEEAYNAYYDTSKGMPYDLDTTIRETAICLEHSIDEINRQKAEIERLQQKYELSEAEREANVKGFTDSLAAVKSEAIKEFAERAKMLKCHYSETEYTFDFDGVTVDDIDNLVKEMTEDEGK